MADDDDDLDKMVSEEMGRDSSRSIMLARLLDEKIGQKEHLLAVRAMMGGNQSYITSVKLRWFGSAKVLYAKDLPVFKDQTTDGNNRVIVSKSTIDQIQQRRPDWRRQLPMTMYLAQRKYRKFPPLVLVCFQEWIYDKTSPNWDKDRRALKPSLSAMEVDNGGVLLDLEYGSSRYYALDGQHRLMAIQGLSELLSKGRIAALREDGTAKPKEKTIEDVIEQICGETGKSEGEVQSSIQGILDERIGIEILPAVQMGETLGEAVSRLRRVFVDINENARKLKAGQIAQLDEDNGFRIVARGTMVEHGMLINEKEDEKTNTEKGQLRETSSEYTTLEALGTIAKDYLGQHPDFKRWGNYLLDEKELGFIRPDEDEIRAGIDELKKYFDMLEKLPSHVKFIGHSVDNRWVLRSSDGDDNILFRPMGQKALARAVGQLVVDGQFSLEMIGKKLKFAEETEQMKLRVKTSPWYGIIWNPSLGKVYVQEKKIELCERMFVYLLGGLKHRDPSEEEKLISRLREDFLEARVILGEGNLVVNYDGSEVLRDKAKLPSKWGDA